MTATAYLNVATGDVLGQCWIARGSKAHTVINLGVGPEDAISVAETAAIPVTAGDTLEEICETGGNNGSDASDAGIVAIRVLSSSHK